MTVRTRVGVLVAVVRRVVSVSMVWCGWVGNDRDPKRRCREEVSCHLAGDFASIARSFARGDFLHVRVLGAMTTDTLAAALRYYTRMEVSRIRPALPRYINNT